MRVARRRLIQALAASAFGGALATAAHGAIPVAAVPRRVIVMNWDLTEMLLSLGIAPVGVPAPAWYTSGVVAPPLPKGVVDIGLLYQPNYDLLFELRPDLLIVTPSHASMKASFERIAPTLTLGAYASAPHPYGAMRGEVATLAQRLGVTPRADALLQQTGTVMAQSRAALDAAQPANGYRPVFVAQIVDDRHLRLYGAGTLFDDILNTLGLRNAARMLPGTNARAVVELDQLANAPEAAVLWVGAGLNGDAAALQLNPVWRELPFAQPGRSAALPVISGTGALISAQRFARAVVSAVPNIHVI